MIGKFFASNGGQCWQSTRLVIFISVKRHALVGKTQKAIIMDGLMMKRMILFTTWLMSPALALFLSAAALPKKDLIPKKKPMNPLLKFFLATSQNKWISTFQTRKNKFHFSFPETATKIGFRFWIDRLKQRGIGTIGLQKHTDRKNVV